MNACLQRIVIGPTKTTTAPVGRTPVAPGRDGRGLGAGAEPDGGRGGPWYEGRAGGVHVRTYVRACVHAFKMVGMHGHRPLQLA